jgi:hypothetical protein
MFQYEFTQFLGRARLLRYHPAIPNEDGQLPSAEPTSFCWRCELRTNDKALSRLALAMLA